MKGKTGFFKTLRGGLFFKYFLSYFLVFSVPLLLTLFVYSSSARIISAQSSGQATSLLGLLLCYLLTKKNSKPLKLIIRSLTTVYDHGRFDPEDDFQFIENAVSALVASNLAYHEKEKDIGSKTDGEVLWRLFLGEGIDTATFQRDWITVPSAWRAPSLSRGTCTYTAWTTASKAPFSPRAPCGPC